MKHLLLHFTLSICTTCFANKQLLAPLQLDSAEKAYAAGNYQGALEGYLRVADGLESAPLYLNIGNCYFKLGDIPHAVLNLERAQKLDPGAEDIQANLDLVRQQVVDRTGEPVSITLGTWWGKVRGGSDPDRWARWSLWMVSFLFAALIGYILLEQMVFKRTMLVIAGTFLLLSIATMGMAFLRHKEITSHDEAIIMAPKVDVHGEPREGSTIVFVLHEGTKVQARVERDGWMEVKLANGSVGWATPGSLERI